ncbi:hypothetical protein ERX37_07190 [Macrococcus hajekii]|uniref:Branched-chain amino acid transport system II carrier protein n=1 Tax=Macrococcus hajekii TaxID=198482 RepID=A0A4R6BJV1_9STAP|nr:hypothetical protein [Macrococcus hajekii]TDM01985.1 hypothetical protein ERX37_07190 [Macrococcus hajekii]GGB09062.1 membrane protein [Macrococcus hajekii]
MKKIFVISSAFIGIIVGAGFASGQEILQYFTSYGLAGVYAAILATILFTYIGMNLVWLGSRFKATDHQFVIKEITDYPVIGRLLSWIIDIVLIITLFSFGVVMLAGAGSNLEQQFGVPPFVGTLLMTILVILCGMLNVDKVVSLIANITPFIIGFLVLISIYSFMTLDVPLSSLEATATSVKSPFSSLIVSGLNYVSMNIGLGAAMAIVMGGAEVSRKTAAIGGLVGGLVLGLMITISYFAIFSQIEDVKDLPMPTLGIVNEISPILGILMSVVIFGMIFNTAIGMFYSFAARFTQVNSKKFKIFYTIATLAGFALSFVGFTQLVGKVYPILGNLNYLLVIIIMVAPLWLKHKEKKAI